jgi:hypothetical protein
MKGLEVHKLVGNTVFSLSTGSDIDGGKGRDPFQGGSLMGSSAPKKPPRSAGLDDISSITHRLVIENRRQFMLESCRRLATHGKVRMWPERFRHMDR